MKWKEIENELTALVGSSEGEERAAALATLTLVVVLTSGRRVTDESAATRRLRKLLEQYPWLRPETNQRVLIVEAGDVLTDSIRSALGLGFDVARVVDGGAAREIFLDDATFEVVLCDVQASGLDGPSLLRWLRYVRPELVSHLLFTATSLDLPAARLIAASHGTLILRKPFSREELLAAIQAMGEVTASSTYPSLETTAALDEYALAFVDACLEIQKETLATPEEDREDSGIFKFAMMEEIRLAGTPPGGAMTDDILDRARVLARRAHGKGLSSWITAMIERLPRSEIWLSVKK